MSTLNLNDTSPAAEVGYLNVTPRMGTPGGSTAVPGATDISFEIPRPIAFRGSWSAVTQYGPNDWVVLNAALYLSLTVNTNVNPASSPTDWSLVLAAALPAGGTVGQILAKSTTTDRDVQWVDPTVGGSGTPGTPGAIWRAGSGVPSNTTGIDGDFYLNVDTGDVYERLAGTYTLQGNIKGPQGIQGSQGIQGIQGIQGVPGTAGLIASRGTVNLNTASIADQATETGTVTLGKTFTILAMQTNSPCRVRLYSTAAYRDADLGRAATTQLPLNAQHGCILDLQIDATMGYAFPTTWVMSPLTYGADLKAVPDGNIPYSVQNLSGLTSSVQLVFTRTFEEQ